VTNVPSTTRQTAAPPDTIRSLESGDIAPSFRLVSPGGEEIDPGADHVSGKPLVLLFQPAGAALPAGLGALAAKVRALGGRAFLIAAGLTAPKDAPPGFEPLQDADGKVSALYGVAKAARIVTLAPNRHVAAIGEDPAAAIAALERIAARRALATNHPPILIVPDVLSRADCQKLIGIYTMTGHTFLEPGHGAHPPGMGDYKMRIPEYGRKDRIDHWVVTPETNGFIDDRLKRRAFPEIRKAFQYKITRREGYRIGCYEGERGGDLHGHRDNTKPNVAHRRFACSINLNTEQFEGGGIRFPEFGDQEYRPETGAAIVFSSSLLHEPMHVTGGKRYVLLAFIYGET
jgi:hypothetical protein